jgi:hypothetical protein
MDGYQKISDCIRDLQAILEEKGDLPICLCFVSENGIEIDYDYQFEWLESTLEDGSESLDCAFMNMDEFDVSRPPLKVIK